MKWFFAFIAFAALRLVSALKFEPVGHSLVKRANYNDVANIGFATLNGGTSGGSGGEVTVVTNLADLISAVSGSDRKIIVISGTIVGDTVVPIGSNTTVFGLCGSSLVGIGLRVFRESNVIIRNIKISKVLADTGDAIGIQEANHVWVDHVDLSSDMDHDKDYYDGLIDITHGSSEISITYSKLHDHWKASLVGHSDSNGAEDAKITVTYAFNYWLNLNSRVPHIRFGRAHIYNNVYENVNDAINVGAGAQVVVENNVFINTRLPIYGPGLGILRGNDFGGGTYTLPVGSFTTLPYSYIYIPTPNVKDLVRNSAGQTLNC
ncbi:hypothetical protein AX16_006070 [Volvariella volvacea WC 439]|nr:hypothetical protein AX16_006070 [Volvariella volvacea WC 439]